MGGCGSYSLHPSLETKHIARAGAGPLALEQGLLSQSVHVLSADRGRFGLGD